MPLPGPLSCTLNQVPCVCGYGKVWTRGDMLEREWCHVHARAPVWAPTPLAEGTSQAKQVNRCLSPSLSPPPLSTSVISNKNREKGERIATRSSGFVVQVLSPSNNPGGDKEKGNSVWGKIDSFPLAFLGFLGIEMLWNRAQLRVWNQFGIS